MLLVFVAFIALINALFNLLGSVTGTNQFLIENSDIYNKLSLELIFGYIFAPIAG